MLTTMTPIPATAPKAAERPTRVSIARVAWGEKWFQLGQFGAQVMVSWSQKKFSRQVRLQDGVGVVIREEPAGRANEMLLHNLYKYNTDRIELLLHCEIRSQSHNTLPL